MLFVSSTAVYGDAGGDWIDETTTPEPGGFSGRIIREAEDLLVSRLGGTGITPVVLRLGGIYGPGRTRLIDQVRGGSAVIPAESRFTNRIHRDDAAAAIVHLCTMDAVPAPVYLGVDNEPAEMGEVLRFLAAELGLPQPPSGAADGTGAAAGRRRRAVPRRQQTLQQRTAAEHRIRVHLPELPGGLPGHSRRRRRTVPLRLPLQSPPQLPVRGTMELPEIIEAAGRYMDVAGVAVMVIGAVVSIPLALRGFRPRRQPAGSEPLSVYRSYRQLLGRSILLGLELLVAADIIRTVAVAPTYESVGVLAIIVLIRTFLSFSLELEITGRWPWQKEPDGGASEQALPAEPAEPSDGS